MDIYPEPAAQLTRAFTTTTSLGRVGPDENAPEWTDILTHHRWQSHSGQFDGVHGCIQTALMHKNTSNYAQDRCRCPFASRTLPSPKSPGDVYFYHRFLHRVNHRWVSASILPFLPPGCRARQPNIAVNPSFSIHTATSPPNYGRLCVLHLKSNSCKISGGRRRGGRAVVN